MIRARAELTDDLASGDPGRLRTGILGLLALGEDGDEVDLPALEPWALEAFGGSPPDDLVTRFARLLAHHHSFVPPPSRQHVIRQLVELAVRYGVSQVIDDASLAIQGARDPAAAARDAVGYLRMRGLRTPPETAAAQRLIRHLLEAGSPVRRAATEALAGWPPLEARQAIVPAVLPLVDADQRSLLQNPPERLRKLPTMKFDDVAVNREERYAIGVEQNASKYYIAIPASNGIIDYDEYYEIDKDMFERFRADPDSALPFVERTRKRQEDPRLMYQPSTRRGTPT